MNLTALLCLIWGVTLLYGEMFAYWVPSLWSCSWPHLRHSLSSSSMNGAGDSGDFVKVAVIADPQLMDRTALPLAPRSLALEIAQFYTDLYMRRAFRSTILPFRPDVILFLGDYFDGGPFLSDDEWQESLSRFKHIFDLDKLGKIKDIPVYYIPGNHDIGYASNIIQKLQVVERYEKEFGARNHRFMIGKVDFVAIDAQIIDGKSKGSFTSRTWDFVKNVSSGSNPRVLLTHIPLYRPDSTSCGPHRSSSIINQRIHHSSYDEEITYQNYVTEESSSRLLDLIKPVLVLSGHDHDQCTVTHMTQKGPVKEHTVGTVSWQQGNLFPSFMLLSASNSANANATGQDDHDLLFVHLCFLPIQLYIYIWYLTLLVVTIFVLVLWPKHGIDIGHRFLEFLRNTKALIRNDLFGNGEKAKNEDENCEYEMIWDAEGSMHLIKKPSKAPPTSFGETSSIERGNAVMRPGRRQTQQDQEAAVKVDINGGAAAAKALPRPSRSMARMAIQRVLRVVRAVSIIAVVNVPLYMMLLFKDWI